MSANDGNSIADADIFNTTAFADDFRRATGDAETLSTKMVSRRATAAPCRDSLRPANRLGVVPAQQHHGIGIAVGGGR